jgi:ArsR family transcriptional regulator, arsenate/arsenite/antimonite-responsive transcriptional repressor
MNDGLSVPHKAAQIVKILRAIGEENRMQMIRLLLKGDLCVGALARILNMSKPAVSQHLKVLREAGLIRGEKIGYWTHYRVEKELIQKSSDYLQELIKQKPDAKDINQFICLRKEESEASQERRSLQMCKNCCQQPDKLKTKPGECTPEQIKECHGEDKEHSCEDKKEK